MKCKFCGRNMKESVDTDGYPMWICSSGWCNFQHDKLQQIGAFYIIIVIIGIVVALIVSI